MACGNSLTWLAGRSQLRERAGLRRTLSPRSSSSGVLDLASNDYLGLARDERVIDGAIAAAREWGTGSTGSRLVTGTTELHIELEQALADLVGAPAALVFSSGYLANVAAVTALSDRDCLIVADGGNHASLVDGCRLSKSRVVVVKHGDLAAVERALAERAEARALVVVDAISSVDGDAVPLRAWHDVARRHAALLLVDDAHGIGVRGHGRGSVHEAGLSVEPDVVVTITLSKSLGSQGGAVLCGDDVREHLLNAARPFIFDTALNPPAAGAALVAAGIIASTPELASTVLDRSRDLARAARVTATDSAIVPIVIGGAQEALDLSTALRARGMHVGCFRPPSVPVGTARLRLTARVTLTTDEVAFVSECLNELGIACATSS